MTRYEILLFVHIALAVVWVGGGATLQVLALRAFASTDPARMAAFTADVEWIGMRVYTPASLLALVSGLWLVVDSDAWGFGDDWIVIGLALFAITALAGALFFGPEAGRISKLIAAEGPASPVVQARIRRILALSRADLVLLFLLLYDMAVKPSFDDVWLYVAVGVAAVAAAVLVRRGLAVRPVPS